MEEELVRRAAEHGVAVYAISDYSLPSSARTQRRGRLPAILLGFGALDEASIREGVRRLSQALM